VFRTLISNCPKRKRPQSFCGKSHFTTTMHRLGQSICFTGSTRQPSVAISLRCIAADTPGRRMPSPHRGNATRLRATGTRQHRGSPVSNNLGQRSGHKTLRFHLSDSSSRGDRMHGASPPSRRLNEMRPNAMIPAVWNLRRRGTKRE
jgi:hypothetical protein